MLRAHNVPLGECTTNTQLLTGECGTFHAGRTFERSRSSSLFYPPPYTLPSVLRRDADVPALMFQRAFSFGTLSNTLPQWQLTPLS